MMAKKTEIEFKTETRVVKNLVPCNYNPRQLTQKQFQDLKKSFEKFNYVELCVINTDNVILAGHQRIYTMVELGWFDKEIEVRVPNRRLTKEEFDEYLIRSNKNTGEWDYDLLGNHFELDNLLEWGFEQYELDGGDWESNLDDKPNDDLDDNLEETIKITCPQGLKDSIVKIIQPHLKDLDVKIK